MNKSKISTGKSKYDEFVQLTYLKIHETSIKLADITQDHLDRLKIRQIALEERIANSARQTFPDIEPYVAPTRTVTGKPSSSNQSSILKLNVGGKRVDISRSTLTQIQGSKLALILSGQWDEILPRDKDGRIFMDFDASWLEPIFKHLRDLAIADPSARIPGLIADSQPFGVMPLSSYIGLESLFEKGTVSSDQWPIIMSWIPNLNPAQSSPELIFRGSRDGFTSAVFHAKCDGIPDTITIVRDTNGNVFGGYTMAVLNRKGNYSTSNNSFLVSLSIRGTANPQICRWNGGRGNFIELFGNGLNFSRMATFGNTDLIIADGCNTNTTSYTNLGQAYASPNGNPYFLTGGSNTFQVSEIEVYKFSSTIATDASNTMNTLPTRPNIDAASLSLPGSVQSAQSPMDELLASHHSLFDFLNDINDQYHELEVAEKSLDGQLVFLRSYVDRMMKVKLDVESKTFDEEIIRPSDGIVNFNVGGTIFTVSVGILSQIPESMLWSGYASGRWRAENHELDDDGNIFLDHDPSNFATLITLLRLKSMVEGKEFDKLSQRLLEFDTARMNSFKIFLDYFQIRFGNVGIFDSLIVTSSLEVVSLFRGWGVTIDKLSLVFRGSRDGFTSAAFHAMCDGVACTITIVRDTNGNVFGGYAYEEWNSSGSYVPSTKSILFSLSIRGTILYQHCGLTGNANGNAMYHHPSHLATFGGGHDLYIADGCNINSSSYTNLGHSYTSPNRNPYFLTGGSNTFQVSEIEVWCLI